MSRRDRREDVLAASCFTRSDVSENPRDAVTARTFLGHPCEPIRSQFRQSFICSACTVGGVSKIIGRFAACQHQPSVVGETGREIDCQANSSNLSGSASVGSVTKQIEEFDPGSD